MVTLQALTVTAVMRSNTLGYKGSKMNYYITAEDYKELQKTNADLLAMLERVTNEYRLLGNVAGLGDENPTVSEARALIAQIKGE